MPNKDKQNKIQKQVNDWFYNLDDNHKFELLEPYFPDRAHLMGLTEMWNAIDWSEKVSLWEEE